jgi:hypothetical protein
MEHEAEPGRNDAKPGWTGGEPGWTGGEPGWTGGEPGRNDAVGPIELDDGVRSDAVADTPAEQKTGEPRVDAALKLLERLPGLPVSGHPELFEQVHARLSEVLDELESGSGTAGPAAG